MVLVSLEEESFVFYLSLFTLSLVVCDCQLLQLMFHVLMLHAARDQAKTIVFREKFDEKEKIPCSNRQ